MLLVLLVRFPLDSILFILSPRQKEKKVVSRFLGITVSFPILSVPIVDFSRFAMHVRCIIGTHIHFFSLYLQKEFHFSLNHV